MELGKDKRMILVVITMLAFFYLCLTVFSYFLGFGKGGFDIDLIFKTQTIYASFGVGALIAIFLMFIISLITEHSEYPFYTYFHNPGEGLAKLTKNFKNPFKLFLISLIVFLVLGFFASYEKQTYLGVGIIGAQQFSLGDNIWYNILQVVTSENAGGIAIAAFFVLIFNFFAKRKNIDKNLYLALTAIIFILTFTIYGYINHLLRYSAVESSILKVVGFWFIMGVITIVTGSIIPSLVMHGTNNAFTDLAGSFSNEQLLIPFVFIVIGLIALYIYLYGSRKQKDEEKAEIIQ